VLPTSLLTSADATSVPAWTAVLLLLAPALASLPLGTLSKISLNISLFYLLQGLPLTPN
jgi:hypothetical protein